MRPSVRGAWWLLFLCGSCATGDDPAGGSPPPPGPPPPRAIPGITAADAFPRGCVDCHVVYPDQGLDVRFATILAELGTAVAPALLAKAQACTPPGTTLVGRHPDAAESLEVIPGGCIACHDRAGSGAPAFAALMHSVHLGPGGNGVFLGVFQGECTHCHKFDLARGTVRVPSAREGG